MRRRPLRVSSRRGLAAVAASGVLAGCAGLAAPPHSSSAPRPSNELPSPPPPRQRASGAASPEAAVSAFARAYTNWSYRDVVARMRMLARASIGQARSEMSLAAAQERGDSTLARAGISNRGSVEAVAPLAGAPGRYVVVTRESTAAANSSAYRGLAPAWHITVAAVEPLGTGAARRWVVSSWQPES